MLPNSKKNQNSQNSIDKNLRMMGISAIVLIVLFIYVSIKSESVIQGTSYYIGVIFLFVLLFLTFILQKYKEKIRKIIPQNKYTKENSSFGQELETASIKNNISDDTQSNSNSYIEPKQSNVTFKDVAGISEIKEELEEVVDFLNNPKKYQKYGVSLPKGVLLVGPPGVGKTLIAKAVAGEAEVPFFYQSGASFVHIYVGMGAKRVKELFTIAKAKAPSIIFIDEIDAVGKSRGIGANDEREATLNELLTQMDGFDSKSGVMVIAATNKIEVLDEALLRAGRFDRRVFLTLPNKDDRLKILSLYLKNKKFDFDINKLSASTSGFSSSALTTLINEALLNMIKRDDNIILEEDIALSKQKIQFGKKQVTILDDKQKDILATYQAGKAFIMQSKVNLLDNEVVSKDLNYLSKSELEKEIQKYLAGTISLVIIKNESYAIFPQELKEAYDIASQMVEIYKMENDAEMIINRLKEDVKEQILQNVDEVKRLKDILLKDEVVVF